MARMTMTSAMARAAAQDAANRQMRKAGRKKWSRADYNLAVRTFDRLWPSEGRVARRGAAKASPSRRSQPRDKKGRFIKRRARR